MTEPKHYSQMQDLPIDAPPRSIVSLVPSMTETLFDLALGHLVVGRTDYCVRPLHSVQTIPSVGGTKNPRVDQIIALKPDLVIANREENRREDVEALQAAGLAVWVTFPQTVLESFNVMWNLMYLCDVTTMVERVRLIEYTYDWLNAIALRLEVTNPLRVFCPIWLDPLMTINRETYVHDVIRVCGGTNVFADRERLYPLAADLGTGEALPPDDARVVGRDTRYPRITWEEVEAAQPDVILLPDEPFAFNASHLPQFLALDVPAARSQRVHLVDGSLLTWHGTRVAYAFDVLPRLLRPTG
jgi:ABC-type Fe3+-hydroxamate transport system substrate-binding protein